MTKLRSDVKYLAWEQRKEEVSIFTKVERILERHGVKIQVYHGGTLTGVAIIAMLSKHRTILDEITSIAFEVIDHRSQDNLPL